MLFFFLNESWCFGNFGKTSDFPGHFLAFFWAEQKGYFDFFLSDRSVGRTRSVALWSVTNFWTNIPITAHAARACNKFNKIASTIKLLIKYRLWLLLLLPSVVVLQLLLTGILIPFGNLQNFRKVLGQFLQNTSWSENFEFWVSENSDFSSILAHLTISGRNNSFWKTLRKEIFPPNSINNSILEYFLTGASSSNRKSWVLVKNHILG